jgi:hypothetical protein
MGRPLARCLSDPVALPVLHVCYNRIRQMASRREQGRHMLPLDSQRWAELTAAGSAQNIPTLLRQLEQEPDLAPLDYREDPWFSLWGALCHQGDVYTASYAAVPHIIRIGLSMAAPPHWQFFALPTCIELARLKPGSPAIPADVAQAYFASLQQLHDLTYRIASVGWSELLTRSVAAALAVSKGHFKLGRVIEELAPEVVQDFLMERGFEADE